MELPNRLVQAQNIYIYIADEGRGRRRRDCDLVVAIFEMVLGYLVVIMNDFYNDAHTRALRYEETSQIVSR